MFIIFRAVVFSALFILSGCASQVEPLPVQTTVTEVTTVTSPSSPKNSGRTTSLSTPHHIALLVPLKGSLASSGKAIQSGFLAEQQANPETQTAQVETIDTSDQPNIQTAYQQAIDKGADFIVGPLEKADVKTLSSTGNISTPILTLNYLDPSQPPPANLYQFGLSPLDEAKQVVALAKQKDHHAAIIMAPKGEWGTNVAQTYSQEWRALGGSVTATLLYDNSNKEMSAQIKRVLQFNQAANKKAKSTRRQDFDVILLAASSSTARQIQPLLKFYYAGDVPVYATSLVYSGYPQPALDSDLDGTVFCDAPWILNEKHTQTNARLFALGRDAYHLATQLNRLQGSADSLQGDTGNLFLNDEHRVVRKLVCAQFRDGIPVVLEQGSG